MRILAWAAAATLLCALGDELPVVTRGAAADTAAYSREFAPGMLVSLFGKQLCATSAAAPAAPLPTMLGGVSVEVDDGRTAVNVPLFFVSPEQINAQLPFDLAGSSVTVRVRNSAGVSAADTLTLFPNAPRLFVRLDGGNTDALALHLDGSLVTEASPAKPGEFVIIYLNGMGATRPAAVAGEAAPSDPLCFTGEPLVSIGGQPAAVLFSGLAPGFVGVYQANLQLPSDLLSGRQPLAVRLGEVESQLRVTIPVASEVKGREYFVSPAGGRDGDGSREAPWDLATALSHPRAVSPGDTIWLRAGTYGNGRTQFASALTGSPGKPIVVRQYPGERAMVDGGLLVRGAHAWYWGFEVMSSLTDRSGDASNNASGAPEGFFVEGPYTRFINLVVHDTRQGFGFWIPAENAEIYGCLIYHNGWEGPTRGQGHGIYTQNAAGSKIIDDNVIFNQFGMGIQAYGSANSSVKGYSLKGNVVFNNGALHSATNRVDNVLFAIPTSVERVRLEENHFYHTPADDGGYSRLGWGFNGRNGELVVRNNYWIGGYTPLELWSWDGVTFGGNTLYGRNSLTVLLSLAEGQTPSPYVWAGNRYYGSGKFSYQGKQRRWEEWTSATGLDAGSEYTAGAPRGVWKFVRPNRYEPRRAHIVIYNWDRQPTVAVDPAGVLRAGSTYELRDAQNYFAAPLARGTYAGGEITIPMSGLSVAAPVGAVPAPPRHTAPEFGAFVLIGQ